MDGGCYGRYVSGPGPSAPLVAANQAASLVNRTDAAVLALTTALVDARRNVALASARVAGLAAALWRSQRERSPLKRSPRVSAASDALAAGLGALAEPVRATCDDPADAIRPLCALASLARACAQLEPTSYDNAVGIRDSVAELIDAEAETAADAGDVDSCRALRDLRTAAVDDLATRGVRSRAS